jgi:tetratricopeptide (TPR) repeat protein
MDKMDLEKNNNINVIGELINNIKACRTVFFCGAGISRNSGLPIVNQLVPYILNKLELPNDDIQLICDSDNNLCIPFELFIERIQANCEPELIYDIYQLGEPNSNHIFLAKLIKKGYLKTIVTMNFDKLIEKALAMDPNPLLEGKDYHLIYKEEDLKNINWDDDTIRIIKIHGSIDDKYAMSITLKQVAQNKISEGRSNIISQIFANGTHEDVIILGYSSSDSFDISPQIESIYENRKKVYYIQHSDDKIIESIKLLQNKNPFKNFESGLRIHINTNILLKTIWENIFVGERQSETKCTETKWKDYVDKWYLIQIKDKDVKYNIPAEIFERIGHLKKALFYYKQSLVVNRKEKNIEGEGVCLGNIGNIYGRLNEIYEAEKYYKESFDIAKNTNNKKEQVVCLNNLGTIEQVRGNTTNALKFYERALKGALHEQSLGIIDSENAMKSIIHIGDVYTELGDVEKAIVSFKHALELSFNIGDKECEQVIYYKLGELFEKKSEYQEAIKNYEQSILIANDINDLERLISSLTSIGNVYYKIGEYQKAIEIYEENIKKVNIIGDIHISILCHRKLGHIHEIINQSELALNFYFKALSIADKSSEVNDKAIVLGCIGAFYNLNGEPQKALEYLGQALTESLGIANEEIVETTLENIGRVYDDLYEYESAAIFYNEALSISKKNISLSNRQIWLNNMLGDDYCKLGNHKKALSYYQKAYNNAKKHQLKKDECECLNNLGKEFNHLNELDNAFDYFCKSLTISIELNDLKMEASILGNLGNYFTRIEEYNKAIEQFTQALKIEEKLDDKNLQEVLLGNLGTAYLLLDNYILALNYYMQALNLANENNNKIGGGIWLGGLGNVSISKKEYSQAIGYYNKALEILVPTLGYNNSYTIKFENNLKFAISESTEKNGI